MYEYYGKFINVCECMHLLFDISDIRYVNVFFFVIEKKSDYNTEIELEKLPRCRNEWQKITIKNVEKKCINACIDSLEVEIVVNLRSEKKKFAIFQFTKQFEHTENTQMLTQKKKNF